MIKVTVIGPVRLLRADGSQVSQHVQVREAYEVASRQPPGKYLLVTPDETIVVTSDVVAPPSADSDTTLVLWQGTLTPE